MNTTLAGDHPPGPAARRAGGLVWMMCAAAGLLAAGCSREAPSPEAGVEVRMLAGAIEVDGVPAVLLCMTNATSVAVLVQRRAVIREGGDRPGGIEEPPPRFLLRERPEQPLIYLILEPAEGVVVRVSPVPGNETCRLEFECTPGRRGLGGLADATVDRFWSFVDRGQHRSFRASGFRIAVDVPGTGAGRSRVP